MWILRLIPKADRKKIHEYLFREGVAVAKKDFETKHPDMYGSFWLLFSFNRSLIPYQRHQESLRDQGVPVAHLAWLCQNPVQLAVCSIALSHAPVLSVCAIRYYYYTLTEEGLSYLREWLHLPAEIVPATHVKQQRSNIPPRGMLGDERRPPRGGDRGDREGGYRRREFGSKEGGAPGEFQPQL